MPPPTRGTARENTVGSDEATPTWSFTGSRSLHCFSVRERSAPTSRGARAMMIRCSRSSGSWPFRGLRARGPVYVLVDDAIADGEITIPARPGPVPVRSDAELLTIALVQHLLERRSEAGFLHEVGRDWAHLFPCLPDQRRGHRAQPDFADGAAGCTTRFRPAGSCCRNDAVRPLGWTGAAELPEVPGAR